MKWFKNLKLSDKLAAPVMLSGMFILLSVLVSLYIIKANNTKEAGLSTATLVADQIKTIRSFYTTEIASRAQQSGMEINYDYKHRENTLPLPATFTRALGEQIAADYPGVKVRLYSRYPFPHRKDTETYDTFELEALAALEQAPDEPIIEVEEVDGRQSLRYAVADVMTNQGCVNCHNSHPESPKIDWKIDDVRGVIEVILPVDEVGASMARSAGILGIGVTFGFTLLVLVVLGVLRRVVLKPIVALQAGITRVGGGDLDVAIEVKSQDEIGDLATTFNEMVNNVRDMTEAIQQEKASTEQAVLHLESFSYSVSHDLRAPLRAIDGFAEILVEDYAETLPPKAQAYLQTIQQSAHEMDRLIQDLLNFSRLGRQALMPQRIDVEALARGVFEDLLVQEQSHHHAELVLGALPVCQADPVLLRQVWVNLLSNAFKFSRDRPAPRIEVGALQQQDETIYFVKDNGVGFDMQYTDKLFGVFQRLHLAEEYEGTGVGLALVQQIVRRHGGRVWAEAALDEGATFFFTLGRA